jgi:hypothetical protein
MTMLWINGGGNPVDATQELAYCHWHPFNVGQHVAHNEMLDECVRRGVDWHIRMDDDCWINSRTWLRKMLAIQEQVKTHISKYAVLSPTILGLDNPPPAVTRRTHGIELKQGAVIESVDILGGIFRMSPMYLMRYFRWDERQAMGYGDATQFKNYCESTDTPLFRVRTLTATHGESTRKQNEKDADWGYEHDMLQYMPLGL